MKSILRLISFIFLAVNSATQGAQPTSNSNYASIGDGGVPLMFVPWNSPLLVNLQQAGLTPLQYEQSQLTGILNNAASFGLQGVQYYLGWGVVEPSQGQWDWSQTILDAQAIKAQGLEFIPYGWVQNQPKWVHWTDPNNPGVFNPAYTRAMNVDNGLETDALSIYAPETKAAYDLYYSNLKANVGAYIDKLRFASPYDYGESAYPNGGADASFPMINSAAAFWVGEAPARAHFQATMQTKYGSLANLNAAWGTAFTDFSALPYPTDNTKRRYWLDFMDWYHTGETTKIGELLDVVRGYFPTTLININIGWPYEKLNLGQDISGLIKMAAQKGISVCVPTGAAVPFLNTKRTSTAFRFYGGPSLASEVGGGEPLSGIAMTFFKDLSDDVNWPFTYGANLTLGSASFSQFKQFSSVVSHQVRIDTALLFPTTSHRLDDWNSWRQAGTSGGYPGNLQSVCESVRDICDYGVIDEAMISDGALAQYKILVWPVGTVAETQTITAISTWIQNGGVLLALDFTNIRDVDGNAGAFAALSSLPLVGDMRAAGKGYIFDAAGSLQKVLQWITQRGNMQPLNAAYPAQISTFPVIDNTSNGVLTTDFSNGALLFNSSTGTVTVTLPALDAQGTTQQVTVPSYTMAWVARNTQVPVITSITPASAQAGSTVTINGSNLTGTTQVKFNGTITSRTIISNTANQVVVKVPNGAITGALFTFATGGVAASPTSFTVNSTPLITSSSPLPTGTIGTIYSQMLTASSGTPGYTWTVSGGTLPGGLSLSTSGVLSGTPTGIGVFNFTLQVTDSLLSSNTAAFSITVNPPSYTSWKIRCFTAAQQANPAISGVTANPSGDGMPNLLKYAFGLNPGAKDFMHWPSITTQGTFMQFSYRQQPLATDVTYTVQVSDDLVTWNSGPSYTALVSQSDNGDGTNQVIVRDVTPISSQQHHFMRLVVNQN